MEQAIIEHISAELGGFVRAVFSMHDPDVVATPSVTRVFAPSSRAHWDMDRPTASDVLRAMVAMIASGDPSDAEALVARDYLDHQGVGEGPMHGVEGFAQVVRIRHKAYRHQSVSIEDLFGVDERAVARIRWRGRRVTGESVDRETIDIIRIAQGRAVEHWGART